MAKKPQTIVHRQSTKDMDSMEFSALLGVAEWIIQVKETSDALDLLDQSKACRPDTHHLVPYMFLHALEQGKWGTARAIHASHPQSDLMTHRSRYLNRSALDVVFLARAPDGGLVDVVAWLLDQGAPAEGAPRPYPSVWTPLQQALAAYAPMRACELLVEYGASLDSLVEPPPKYTGPSPCTTFAWAQFRHPDAMHTLEQLAQYERAQRQRSALMAEVATFTPSGPSLKM